MKTFKNWKVVPAALVMLLASIGAANAQTTQISPGFQPDPLVVSGTSGGSVTSKGCGMIGAAPSYVLNLATNFNYLRFSVQSAGQPTLLIQGPSGSSCVQAVSGGNINVPGYWEKGTYSIHVGDRAGGQHPFTLSISQKRQ
jgi:hypothetical protein